MANLYLDTNIYLDLWENRTDKIRPLGEFAFQLIKRALSCEFTIYYSELVIDELCNYLKICREKCFRQFLEGLYDSGKLIQKELSEEGIKKAAMIKRKEKLPYADIIHLLISKENNLILVTRDNHFDIFREEIEVRKPEEL